jgi:hypothetical protein
MAMLAERIEKGAAVSVPQPSLQRPGAQPRAGAQWHAAPAAGARRWLSDASTVPQIQRKCAGCGGAKKRDEEECGECSRGTIAREAAGTQPTPPMLPVSEPGDRLEVEADRAADQAMRALDGEPAYAPADGTGAAAPIARRLQRQAAEAAPAKEAAGGLIVDDDAQSLTDGQMRKGEFLEALKIDTCAAVDLELARVGRDTSGCPHVERWLTYYQGREPSQLERAIRRFAPGATAARTARDYIPIVSARMAAGAAQWATTGQIPADVPPELRDAVTGGPAAMGGVASAIGGALSAIGGAIGRAFSSIGRLFFKAESGGRPGADRAALSSRLGPGTPLEGGTRARMESAYGHSFANVRIHADTGGAALSRDLDAHAFTLGEHVAFAAGQYRPGTPAGDALLAHELAHVIQQGGDGGPAPLGADLAQRDEPAERDADAAAVSTMATLYAPGAAVRKRSVSRRQSGLRLQRCASGPAPRPATGPASSAAMLPRTGAGTGEGQGTLPPLPPGQAQRSYSVGEFITAWERQHGGQRMPDDLRGLLYAGCIGITALNLGESTTGPGHPPLSFCYDTLANAQAAASRAEQGGNPRPYIYSKHFWSRGRSYAPSDPSGRVDMRQHSFADDRRRGSFDYGWYDEQNNTFLDANHCDPRAPGCNTSEAMQIIQNTPQEWASQVSPNSDYDVGVYCIWHPSWPASYRIPN